MTYNKYHVSKKEDRTYNNIVFASKKEMNRYKELLLLLKGYLIFNLILQPTFILQDSFVDNTGIRQREIIYRADFSYVEDLDYVVEDVKGVKTKEYLLKKKLFLKKYPEYKFIET